jgi:PII-like signaling protein
VTDFETATLLRIFLDEGERWEHRPLFEAIVEELRRNGFAGATVLKGIEGFGASGAVRSARTFDYSASLPILIEVAESEERVHAILPHLREMMSGGLITLERVRIRLIRKANPS